MTDEAKALVERLREDGYSGHNPLCLEAADRIEALDAEVEAATIAKVVAWLREGIFHDEDSQTSVEIAADLIEAGRWKQ